MLTGCQLALNGKPLATRIKHATTVLFLQGHVAIALHFVVRLA